MHPVCVGLFLCTIWISAISLVQAEWAGLKSIKGRFRLLSKEEPWKRYFRISNRHATKAVPCQLWNPLGCILLFTMNPPSISKSNPASPPHDNDTIVSLSSWLRRTITNLGDVSLTRRLYWNRVTNGLKHLNEARKTSSPFPEVLATVVATVTALTLWRVGTQRFRTAMEIPAGFYNPKGKTIKGYVVAVNDSDNLRLYHPSWFSRWWRAPRLDRGESKTETINIRLAGIDAPEMGHFGGTPQPFAAEAKQWLTKHAMGRPATIRVHRIDQYSRVVATVWIRHWWFFKRNVSLEMIKAGYATVYTGAGAEYGTAKEQLINAEKWAKRCRRGMWKQSSSEYVSPAEYKRQLKQKVGNVDK